LADAAATSSASASLGNAPAATAPSTTASAEALLAVIEEVKARSRRVKISSAPSL